MITSAHLSTPSSQHSSLYSTPQGTTPRYSGSHYSTPHQRSGMNTPYRSTQQPATADVMTRHDEMYNGGYGAQLQSQSATFQKQVSHPQPYEAPPDPAQIQPGIPTQQPTELPPELPHQIISQLPPQFPQKPMQTDELPSELQHQFPPQFPQKPMQTDDKNEDGGTLCMPTPPYYSSDIYQKVTSVFMRAPLCGIPHQHSIEMKELANKVQQLEEDKQMIQRRFESMRQEMNRNVLFMKNELSSLEQQIESERIFYENRLQKCNRHIHDVTLYAKQQEFLVAQLREQLRQARRPLNGCHNGRDYTDSLNVEENGTDFPDGGEDNHDDDEISAIKCEYTSWDDRKARFQSFKQETIRNNLCSDSAGEKEVEEVDSIETFDQQETSLQLIHKQVQTRLEERHSEMEMKFVEHTRMELANHHLTFLEVNSRIIEVVSQSLEHLTSSRSSTVTITTTENNCEDDGVTDDTTGTAEGLEKDLKWLQESLESCRLARHASCP